MRNVSTIFDSWFYSVYSRLLYITVRRGSCSIASSTDWNCLELWIYEYFGREPFSQWMHLCRERETHDWQFAAWQSTSDYTIAHIFDDVHSIQLIVVLCFAYIVVDDFPQIFCVALKFDSFNIDIVWSVHNRRIARRTKIFIQNQIHDTLRSVAVK